ncbi:MAG: outer membrane beta-barrel protein [Phenylobacterium sp.]|uniref:outer membrane beta-barrel protein n=1 Tax=Phenylobacterium sp. TaxID=1871053 RepID=UPI0027179F45|nr:outer membrane beta-barrel protein [Phenylobacterium sp.]MDO8408739.1 outer membrane beta-barrel protein [Phenylobacterium sp.]
MTANKRVLAASAAIAVAAGFTPAAEAQTARGALNQVSGAESNFARDRNISVRQRPHEGYEALGLRLGTFMAYPKVSVTAEHNDNIYGVATNETDDLIWRVQPEISLNSGWSRHALQARARASINRYQDNGSEDTDDYTVGASGRLDVSRATQIAAGADWSRMTEPRTSSSTPQASTAPIQYDLASANVGLSHEFNRLRVSGRYDIREYDYEDGRTAAGTPIEQDDRDRKVHAVTARADYAVSPATALFVEVSRNWREYDLTPPAVALTRDSEGTQALVGANFELGALVRGEVGVGYITQEYDDPRFDELEGLGARAQVEWFPTQLTTVSLTGSRTVEDSGIPGSSGYLSTNVGAQVDHELMRNIILTGQASYGQDEYEGVDRDDDRLNLGVSGTYLLNRYAGLTVAYSYFDQSSGGADGGNDFKVNKLGATLTLQF